MKSVVLVGIFAGFVGALIGLGVGATTGIAAPQAARIGFVIVPEIIKATSAGSALKKIEEIKTIETKPISDALKELQPKMRAATASFEEREQWDKLSKQYADISKKYDAQYEVILKPFEKKLGKSIALAAQKSGYSLVVDGVIATDSGLLLYADQTAANITKQVTSVFKNLP